MEHDRAVEAEGMLLEPLLAETCNHKGKAPKGKAAHTRDHSRLLSGTLLALHMRRCQTQKGAVSRLPAPAANGHAMRA